MIGELLTPRKNWRSIRLGDTCEIFNIEEYDFGKAGIIKYFHIVNKRDNSTTFLLHTREGGDLYIWNYFYTKAELREQQIDSILK